MTVIFLPTPSLTLSKPALPTVSCSALPATLPNHFNSCPMRFRERSLQVGAKLFLYLCFRPPGIFYFDASPHSAFCNLLILLVEFILPAYVVSGISNTHTVPQGESTGISPLLKSTCLSLEFKLVGCPEFLNCL